MVGVDEVVGGEGVRADGGTTGVQGFLCEEEEVGKKGRCGGGEDETSPSLPPSLPPFLTSL